MNTKEKYIVASIFTAMFLLQIWVADAEGERVTEENQLEISDLSPQALQALNKMMNDSTLREQAGFGPKDEAVTPAVVKNEIKKDKKEKNEEADFVWYKPWTWFK